MLVPVKNAKHHHGEQQIDRCPSWRTADRQTERQTDRQAERHTQTQRNRQRGTYRERQTDRQTDRHATHGSQDIYFLNPSSTSHIYITGILRAGAFECKPLYTVGQTFKTCSLPGRLWIGEVESKALGASGSTAF